MSLQTNNDIIENLGEQGCLALDKIVNVVTDENELETIAHSPYYTIGELPNFLHNCNTNFSILCLNAQSIFFKI